MSANENDLKGTKETPAAGGARLVSSDAKPDQAAVEQRYFVDGKSVSRDDYMAALPKAGYDPARMPANHYPAINTK